MKEIRYVTGNSWIKIMRLKLSVATLLTQVFRSPDRTIRTSVRRATALRSGGLFRGLALLHPADIRPNTRCGSHGNLIEIRRRSGLRCQQAVFLVSGPRSRNYRRGSHWRRRKERHLGGVAKLSRRQNFYGHSRKSNFSHTSNLIKEINRTRTTEAIKITDLWFFIKFFMVL